MDASKNSLNRAFATGTSQAQENRTILWLKPALKLCAFRGPQRALFNRRWLFSLGSFQFVYRLLDVPVIYLRSAGEDGQLSRARTGGRGAPGTAGKMPALGFLTAIVAGEGARPHHQCL